MCAQHLVRVRIHAESLGFTINLEKSQLTPSQTFTYLGMLFDIRTMQVSPRMKCLEALKTLLMDLRARPAASARQLSSMLGMMESLASLIPQSRLHKRSLQRGLLECWSVTTSHWVAMVPLGDWFRTATDKWLDETWLNAGVPDLSATAADGTLL